MLLVTNISRFPTSWVAASGEHGTTRIAHSAREFLRYGSDPDCVFLVNCDPGLTMKLASHLILRRSRTPFACSDLVLRRPGSPRDRVAAAIKRVLLKRVDHHILHFRDLRGVREVYGIDAEKSSFVPFKSNITSAPEHSLATMGEYVLCFGRSMRDFDTFFSAMELIPFPGAIAAPDFVALRAHGSRFTRKLTDLPRNVRILDERNFDGSLTPDYQLRVLGGARLVVLPILKSSIVASGISVALSAMRLGRCVIGSAGPGMSDVFTTEVLTVPPEDHTALAQMIARAWTDDALRQRTAQSGFEYAVRAGTEQDLYQRFVDCLCDWRGQTRRRLPPREPIAETASAR